MEGKCHIILCLKKTVKTKGKFQNGISFMHCYLVLGGKPYLVGVFSRGDECGTINQPGIYTNILPNIDWIMNNSKDGDC